MFFALVLVYSCITNKTKIKGETCRPEKDCFDYKGETLNHSDKLNFNKLYLFENGFSVGFGPFSIFDMFQEVNGHITNQIFREPVNGVINVQKIDMGIPPPNYRERQ